MRFGAAYYPEHVAPERWAVDAQLMVQAGLSVIRIGEFAWCRMEPREDEFTLDWMEQTLAVFAARGIAVIIGTPTAGPPAWLVNAPTEAADCRQVYENGQRWEFGGRSLCCVNHPRFAARSIAISTALAKRFANHPAVVGFQLDNELGMFGPRCFCATCVSEFRQWMRRKYASIDAVNQRLGMIFGGGEFGSFDDIPLPRQSQDLHNPGLRLDALRFVSDSACTYLRAQVSALRANGVSQPITTNSCHMFGGWLDYDQTTLWSLFDVVGFDCYPSQFGTTPSPNTIGLLHAIARAGKPGTPHWMLEQQAGSPMEMAADDPRRIRLWAWQSILHGADTLLYFPWRTCRFGGEQYWRGILDHDGEVNPRHAMVATVSAEYASVANALSGLNRQHRGAILLDFSALMSLTVAAPGAHFNYRGHAEQWFAAVIHAGHGCDVVFTTDNLSAYDVIIAPLYRVITPASAAHLTAFVAAGGTLIASPLCATVNEDHVALDHGHPPYLLQTLFGIERIEWSSLNGLAAPPKERLGEAYADWQVAHGVGVVPIIAEATPFSGTYACTTWCDHLRLREARVHARFAAGAPAAGLPAITSNPHGNGSAWYVAGVTDQRAMDELVAAVLLRTLPYTSHIASPSRLVEMIPLHTTHGPLMALLNHDHLAHVVTLPAGHDLLRNKTVEAGQVELPAYAVLLMALTEA